MPSSRILPAVTFPAASPTSSTTASAQPSTSRPGKKISSSSRAPGHAGVGSVFDLSNATVAKLLQSKVIIVSRAGIGRPIDEIGLNLALFEKQGVEVIGAVINKVNPEKMAMLKEYATLGLAKLGLPLLGMIPMHTELYKPTVNQACLRLKGTFIAGAQHKRRRVSRIGVGAMSSRNAGRLLQPGTLIVTPGDREDLIMMILEDDAKNSGRGHLAGVVLTDGILPPESVMQLIRERSVPFIATTSDISNAATNIARMTVKTEVGDRDKIGVIQKLVHEHVQVDRIVDLVATGCELPPPVEFGRIGRALASRSTGLPAMGLKSPMGR